MRVESQMYENIYNILLDCGSVHEWKDFSIGVITRLKDICDYNHGRIYFINGNGKISDQYIIGLDKKWVSAYHEYYSKILNGRYAIPTQLNENIPPHNKPVHVRDWSTVENDEFVVDYVRALGINYSLGFSLFDTDGNPRTYFMLDRTSSHHFTKEELMYLDLLVPQLNNMHKKFFNHNRREKVLTNISWELTNLTPREIEVATLLCHGVSPTNISKKLHIAQPTTNKHISHIYAKLHVSNRQELLVRLLNQG
ncbi:MAG: hypothetical protein IJ860_01565 [Eubacterium sp.]|nr:hypothetical protein [Eubacterium sp.]